jgi:ATP:cob(I)alamin adenosyltransferase
MMTGRKRLPSISTGKGDTGVTLSVGCLNLPKYHPCVHFFGSLDETLSFAGLAISMTHHYREELEYIYHILSLVAGSFYKQERPPVKIEEIEERIRKFDIRLRGFISNYLPGEPAVALLSIVRTSIRRTERWYWACVNELGLEDKGIGAILNRLSDYVFLLQAQVMRKKGAI